MRKRIGSGLFVAGGEGAKLSAVVWYSPIFLHSYICICVHIPFHLRSPSSGLCSLPELPHEMVHPTADIFEGVVVMFIICNIITWLSWWALSSSQISCDPNNCVQVLRICHGMGCHNWRSGDTWRNWTNTTHYRHYHTRLILFEYWLDK